jgi:hypothetical protein
VQRYDFQQTFGKITGPAFNRKAGPVLLTYRLFGSNRVEIFDIGCGCQAGAQLGTRGAEIIGLAMRIERGLIGIGFEDAIDLAVRRVSG